LCAGYDRSGTGRADALDVSALELFVHELVLDVFRDDSTTHEMVAHGVWIATDGRGAVCGVDAK
jgi:hypothetical protein